MDVSDKRGLQKASTTPRPHTLEAPRPSSQDGGNDPVQDVSEDLNRRCLPRAVGFRGLGGFVGRCAAGGVEGRELWNFESATFVY